MKNKFCRDTKLNEEEFLSILWGFCGGVTASDMHKVFIESKNPISRQTIAKKYTELGYYLWNNHVKNLYVAMYREANADPNGSAVAIETYILDTLWKAVQDTLDYAGFREVRSEYPGSDILPALKARRKALNGFSREHFAGHVALVVFQTDQKRHDMRYWWFIKQLTETPLDSADI